jgi:hypothetical protein
MHSQTLKILQVKVLDILNCYMELMILLVSSCYILKKLSRVHISGSGVCHSNPMD